MAKSGGAGLSKAAATNVARGKVNGAGKLQTGSGIVDPLRNRGPGKDTHTGGKNGTVKGSTPGGTPPKTNPTTTTPPSDTPAQPGLTPAQQEALKAWNAKYATSLNSYRTAESNGLTTENTGLANLATKNLTNVDTTNQTAASRGLFQSSVRDAALNDIAATLAGNQNTLRTNYSALLTNTNNSITGLNEENSAEQGYYAGLAVTNAQAVPPTTPAPATTPAPTKPATTPATPGPGGKDTHTGGSNKPARNANVNGAIINIAKSKSQNGGVTPTPIRIVGSVA